ESVVAAGATVDVVAAGVNQVGNSNLVAGSLRLRGTGPFSLLTPTNDAATLAASVAGPLTYRDANGLTVGQVTANAVTTAGVNTNANDLTLITGGSLALGDGSAVVENVTAAGHT